MSATPVLYLAGTGRSGSTLLARVLGEAPGVFTGGEFRYIWQRGLLERRKCGCGVEVPGCPVWSEVIARSGFDAATVHDVVRLLNDTARLRHLPALARAGQAQRLLQSRAGLDALAALERLYQNAAAVSGATVLVDSSKLPSYGWLLTSMPGIDLRVVHVVRDPRAAAYSWLSQKPLTDGARRNQMEQMGAGKSALLWSIWNSSMRVLFEQTPDRFCTVRYEDFVAEPEATVRRILAMVGMLDADVSFMRPEGVHLGVNHTVAGNPDRLRPGQVQLRRDDRWRRGLATRQRLVVTTLTGPLLRRFAYTFSVGDPAPGGQTIFDRAAAGEGAAARSLRRARRHLRWLRADGISRLIEEDELDPARRIRVAMAKRRWRRHHGVDPGTAMPVFVVGLQRSGTNMVTRGLDTAPEVEVRNENDRTAFDRFRLRSDAQVVDIVGRSRHSHVLFKPLCDSHRTPELLSLPTLRAARAIWVYRDVDARSRSAVAKFGRNNLLVLDDIAHGRRPEMWQAQGISPAALQTLRAFDYAAMTPATAAALFWWVRNSLFFELGLDGRSDVLLVSYERTVATPRESMQRICAFLGLEQRDSYSHHIDGRAAGLALLDIDPQVRRLCAALGARLDTVLDEADAMDGLTA